MKRIRLILPLAGISILLTVLGHRVFRAHSLTGYPAAAYVSEVIDGDTVKLKNGRLIRYIGIDTPEISQKLNGEWRLNPQPMSREAKKFNEAMVLHNEVTIEYDIEKTDRYDRLLAYVYVNGKMVNEQMVHEGFAFLLCIPPNNKHNERLHTALKDAYSKKKNIWKYADTHVIDSSRAHEYIGTLATVQGKILHVGKSKKASYLNFGSNYKKDFTGVIFTGSKSQLPYDFEISSLKGKNVRIFGMIKEYNGPEIIINSPEQLQIISH